MPNYENIKPYSDFSHTAAEHGGVENYLNELAEKNRELGVLDEKSTEGIKALLFGAVLLTVWEGGKWCYSKLKNRRNDQRKIIEVEIEDAKEKIVQDAENASDNGYEMFCEAVRLVIKKYRNEIHAESFFIAPDNSVGYICYVDYANGENSSKRSVKYIFDKETGKAINTADGIPFTLTKDSQIFVQDVKETFQLMRKTKEEMEKGEEVNE